VENTVIETYFRGLNKYPAPEEWTKYALSYGIGPVWLVDDPSLSRSIRWRKEVFVNIRGDFWRNYAIFNAQTYEESIVLKFLHEIGHIVKEHKGDPKLKIEPGGICESFEKKVRQTPIGDILEDPAEKEAWDFALDIRKNQPEIFQDLLAVYQRWYQNYPNAVNWSLL
jgi:hypothetical protein